MKRAGTSPALSTVPGLLRRLSLGVLVLLALGVLRDGVIALVLLANQSGVKRLLGQRVQIVGLIGIDALHLMRRLGRRDAVRPPGELDELVHASALTWATRRRPATRLRLRAGVGIDAVEVGDQRLDLVECIHSRA